MFYLQLHINLLYNELFTIQHRQERGSEGSEKGSKEEGKGEK